MKKELVKLSTVVLLCCSSVGHADTNPNLIPTQQPGFSMTLTALYLEPSASNLDYAVYTKPLPLPAPNWQQKIVNPAYTGAFDLALQYNLLNAINSMKFDWFHFSSKDTAAANSGSFTSVGPPYYYGPAQQFLLNTAANSSVKFHIDTGNLLFNHLFNVSEQIQFSPFLGLSAAYLQEDITNNYWGADPVYGPYTHAVYSKSTFKGLGPRLGFDSSYFVTNTISVMAGASGELLAGVLDYSTDFTSWTAYNQDSIHNSTPANTAMANQNTNRIVPEVEAKIAMLYKMPLKSSDLTLQAGYMYSVYFNAINQVLPSTLVPASWEAGSVAIINQTQLQSNIDLRGPFISISWKF